MTVKQFLTMTSGLDWPELDSPDSRTLWREFESTSDTIQYVLDRPTKLDQINTFNYNTGLGHILSAIVQNQTGMRTSEYAQQKIFDKIGVTTALWQQAQGIDKGGYRMHMIPRDMAKFGYLYLKNGQWDGEQVIPEQWVKDSIKYQVPTGDERVYYGYYWWLMKTEQGYEEISAMGDNGQYIIIVPELDLVVVQTARDFGNLHIYNDYIYPAVVSSNPIEVDVEGNERLKELTKPNERK